MAVTIAGGLPILLIGLLGSMRKLTRSRWLGLPTVLGVDSDELWFEAHFAGGAALLFGGVAVVMAGLAFGPFALLGIVPTAMSIAVIVAQLVVLITSVVVGSIVGAGRVARIREAAGAAPQS